MFRIASAFPTSALRRRGRTVLRLEDLEGRANPDGGINAPPNFEQMSTVNQRPVIVDFECQEISNGIFVISGRVIDENPSGMVVTLGGSTSASGTTVVCASDGTFSTTITLHTDGSDVGTITATTVDAQGLVSAEVSRDVSPTPP